MAQRSRSSVFIVKTADRQKGVRSMLEQFPVKDFEGQRVAIKANYNSADAFPASTHIDTLSAIEGFSRGGPEKGTTVARTA